MKKILSILSMLIMTSLIALGEHECEITEVYLIHAADSAKAQQFDRWGLFKSYYLDMDIPVEENQGAYLTTVEETWAKKSLMKMIDALENGTEMPFDVYDPALKATITPSGTIEWISLVEPVYGAFLIHSLCNDETDAELLFFSNDYIYRTNQRYTLPEEMKRLITYFLSFGRGDFFH